MLLGELEDQLGEPALEPHEHQALEQPVGPPHPVTHHLQEPDGRARMALEERQEVALIQHQQPAGTHRRSVCGPPLAVDERDLAEHAPGREDRQRDLLPPFGRHADPHPPVQHGHHAGAHIPAPEDHLVTGIAPLAREPQQLVELAWLKMLKQEVAGQQLTPPRQRIGLCHGHAPSGPSLVIRTSGALCRRSRTAGPFTRWPTGATRPACRVTAEPPPELRGTLTQRYQTRAPSPL